MLAQHAHPKAQKYLRNQVEQWKGHDTRQGKYAAFQYPAHMYISDDPLRMLYFLISGDVAEIDKLNGWLSFVTTN
jgi:hypothetical protein